MYKQATELMLNFKDRILIKGEEDTGKSTLLTEIRISNSDSRYYNFKTLNSAGYNRLCDENIDNFDFLNTPEKTLILDGWICPYISRHLLSLNPLLACCRRYSRGER